MKQVLFIYALFSLTILQASDRNKEDHLIRLINAKKLKAIKNAFYSGPLQRHDVTDPALRLARTLKKEDPKFNGKILFFLKKMRYQKNSAFVFTAESPLAEPHSKKEALKCSICLEKLKKKKPDHEPVALLCGDVFHTSCIGTWLNEHSGCPLCRRQYNLQPTNVSLPDASLLEEEK